MSERHWLLLLGVLLGLLQLGFPETLARFSAALSKLVGREPSTAEIRAARPAFRICGVLTLGLWFFVLLGLF